MKSPKKETIKRTLTVAHQLATKVLGSPDAVALVKSWRDQHDVRVRVSALATHWEQSLPALRTSDPQRAIERECCVRELRLALGAEEVTKTTQDPVPAPTTP